jgi:hypothetical protein
MGLMDIVVVGIGLFLMYQNSKTSGTASTGFTDILKKIPFIGSWFGTKNTNDLITKAQLWKQLNDAITDPDTKKVLNQIWPLLNKEVENAQVK